MNLFKNIIKEIKKSCCNHKYISLGISSFGNGDRVDIIHGNENEYISKRLYARFILKCIKCERYDHEFRNIRNMEVFNIYNPRKL